MSISDAAKRDAYLEAQHILRLDKKWQHLMPGERKPNFRRAARQIIQRALGHKTERNEAPLDIHQGLMHEHNPREAALIERTLKNGMYDPSVLQSFQLGAKPIPQRPEFPEATIDDPDLPDIDLYIHSHADTIHHPTYFEPGTGRFHSSVHEIPQHREVPLKVPQGAALPSDYEAVH